MSPKIKGGGHIAFGEDLLASALALVLPVVWVLFNEPMGGF